MGPKTAEELIREIAAQVISEPWGSPRQIALQTLLIDIAKYLGYDWEDDEDFNYDRATIEESVDRILVKLFDEPLSSEPRNINYEVQIGVTRMQAGILVMLLDEKAKQVEEARQGMQAGVPLVHPDLAIGTCYTVIDQIAKQTKEEGK